MDYDSLANQLLKGQYRIHQSFLPDGFDGALNTTPFHYDVSKAKAILKDGGIGVIPKQDTIAATAATLSRFCDANPRATLRFISKKDLLRAKSTSQIVGLSSTGVTSCKKIKGLM